jgi:hypothetical protein
MTISLGSARREVPQQTIDWLLGDDNPAVAALTLRTLLAGAGGGPADPDAAAAAEALWSRRNDYEPVRRILEAQKEDGSWATPARDYQKYQGSLWQIHLLGELWADPADERVRLGAEYAFSRQLASGAWSANGRPDAAIPCLTANVGRALARLGYASDERVSRALGWVAGEYRESGVLGCFQAAPYTLNGYCHMLAPKALLFLAEVPPQSWPDGAEELRDAAVAALRDKHVMRCLPKGSGEFFDMVWSAPKNKRPGMRERFLAEHPALEYGDKPGWLRFGFPLSYNSDTLEALASLAGVGERRRPEYEAALDAVAKAADGQMRWTMRNSLNGKMLADVEQKGAPSKWLSLRALQVLKHFDQD